MRLSQPEDVARLVGRGETNDADPRSGRCWVDRERHVVQQEDPDRGHPRAGPSTHPAQVADEDQPTRAWGRRERDPEPDAEQAVDRLHAPARGGRQVGDVLLDLRAASATTASPTCAWKRFFFADAQKPMPPPTCGLCGSPSWSENWWCLRWSATQARTGPSTAIEPSTAKIQRIPLLGLERPVREQAVEADGDPDTGQQVRPEHRS